MESIGAFLYMGGKAAFVWPSFAVTLGLMVFLAVSSWRRLKASERLLAALQAEAEAAGAPGERDGEA